MNYEKAEAFWIGFYPGFSVHYVPANKVKTLEVYISTYFNLGQELNQAQETFYLQSLANSR